MLRPRGIPVLVLSLALCAAALPVVAGRMALAPGDRAPELRGVLHPDSSSFRSRWSDKELWLVNFWATWCGPCKQEMPALQAMHLEHGERLGIVGVYDQTTPMVDVQNWLNPMRLSYPIVRAYPEVDRKWGGIGAIPTTFLINSEGVILRRYVGATEEQIAGLIADIEAVIDGRPMPPLFIPDLTNSATGPDGEQRPPLGR